MTVRLLRHLTPSPARTGVPGEQPLSDRELSVLRYLPTMMSNQEIASELFLSQKTVETHLSNGYRKLTISSRRQLALALASG